MEWLLVEVVVETMPFESRTRHLQIRLNDGGPCTCRIEVGWKRYHTSTLSTEPSTSIFRTKAIRYTALAMAKEYCELPCLETYPVEGQYAALCSLSIHCMAQRGASAQLRSCSYGIVKPGPISPDPPVDTPKPKKRSRNNSSSLAAKDYKWIGGVRATERGWGWGWGRGY